MRKAIFLLFLFPISVAAQTALSIAPKHCVWKEGDDARWAAPALDESDWKPVPEYSGIATPKPFFWLRCSFEPSLLAPMVDPQLQVRRVRQHGHRRPYGRFGNRLSRAGIQ